LNFLELYKNFPPELRAQVLDFMEFLSNKNKKKKSTGNRRGGFAKGLIKMKPGFDDPLEEFKDYM
jgi:hypothetical protein